MKQEFKDRYQSLVKLDTIQNFTKEMKNQRGRDFEDLINDVMEEEGILLRKGYHTHDNKSEQIDGAIEIENKIFLIETKWVKSNLAASDLYSFIGKIENKFFGTLGLFISKKRLTENFVNALNKGRRQIVIVLHGEDIDHMFGDHDVKISSYISHIIKLISYDNLTHFSFQDYVKLKSPKAKGNLKSTPMTNDIAENFINEKLLQGSLSDIELENNLDTLETEQKDKIFYFVFKNYGKYWKMRIQTLNFKIIQNFDLFLEQYNPGKSTKKVLTKNFYNNLFLDNPDIYHREKFNTVVSQFYRDLELSEKENFEERILELMKKNNNSSNWNGENDITDVISHIWDNFQYSTIQEFKKIYLDIYIRDTLDKFPQKQFANKLVNDGTIDKSFALECLEDKIKKFIKIDKSEIEKGSVEFFARTYYALNKILNVEEKWIDFIIKKFDEIKMK